MTSRVSVARPRMVWATVFMVLALLLLTAATSEAAPNQSCGVYHVVQRGETLSSIGRQYGVPVLWLMRANPGISDPDVIYAGSKVFIPCSSGGPGTGGQCGHVHRVAYGDTLMKISWRYNVHPWAIVRANNIQNPNLIYAGTSLCIP